jgi:hypothetical protein
MSAPESALPAAGAAAGPQAASDGRAGLQRLRLRLSRLAPLPTLLIAVFLCLYNWLPLRDAQWFIIDDHEIMTVIGARERLPVTQIPAALGRTEVGTPGTALRFRPSYYLARLLEASVWGKHPGAWYATRIAIALLASVLLAVLGVRFSGPIMSFGFVAFALSRPYWGGIFGRLGPAEAYAVLGTCLVALGVWLGLARRFGAGACALIVVGCMLAAGSKENFVLLAAVPLWLIFSPRRGVSRPMKALLFAAVIFSLWIAITVGLGLLRAGHDVYSQDVSAGSRLGLLAGLLERPDAQWWLFLTLLLLILASVLRLVAPEGEPGSVASGLRRDVGILSALFAVYLSQYVFYFGKWPDGAEARYLFPGILAAELALLLWLSSIARLIAAALPRSPWRWALPLVVCAGYLGVAARDWQMNRAFTQQMVAMTTTFTRNIELAASYLNAHPSLPLVVVSHNVWDFEPVTSVESFLRAYGVTNPMAVRLADYSVASFPQDKSPLEYRLARELESWQSNGGDGLTPYAALDLAAGCVSLGMSGPPEERCAVRGRIR